MENDFENGPETQNSSEYAAQFSNMFGSGPSGGGFCNRKSESGPDRADGLVVLERR